jgi:hypothetical protein
MNNPVEEPRGVWIILATDCADSRRFSVIIFEIFGKEITTANCQRIP